MPIVTLDARDAIEPTINEFAGWLRADTDHGRHRRPLDGARSIDDLQADTAQLIKILEATRW